jgi:predicted site-specific integrase-resolvase
MEIKAAYTFRETLAILGIGHTALEHWTRDGKIKSYLVGRFRRYPKSEIVRLLGWRKAEEIIRETPEVVG